MQYDYSGSANKKTTEGWSSQQWQTFNGGDFTRDPLASWTGDTFSTTVPSQKYAGTYEVYWRVEGDKNHKDYVKDTAHFPVTIDRRAQTITFDYTHKYDGATEVKENVNAATFCIGGIERTFAINRLQEAKINEPIKSGSTINDPSLSGTTVTMQSNGTEGNTTVTVTISESANYLAGTATFTVTNVQHAWHAKYAYDNTPQCSHGWHGSELNTWPQHECQNSGTGYDYCYYDDCTAETTHTLDPWDHDSVYGGTADCHTYCGRCGITLTGYSSHSFGGWYTTVAATCDKAGSQRQDCACGYYETGKIAATGHTAGSGGWEFYNHGHHRTACRDCASGYVYWGHHWTEVKATSSCCGSVPVGAECRMCNHQETHDPPSCGHKGSTKKRTGGTVRNPKYTTYCDCCGKTM